MAKMVQEKAYLCNFDNIHVDLKRNASSREVFGKVHKWLNAKLMTRPNFFNFFGWESARFS